MANEILISKGILKSSVQAHFQKWFLELRKHKKIKNSSQINKPINKALPWLYAECTVKPQRAVM